MYKPEPLNTIHIDLPDDIAQLMEGLAKNIHDHWAKKRMEEGWILGSNRDSQKKTHPCLVPYEELPEVEKEYDRKLAVETLKSIIAFGYEIKRK